MLISGCYNILRPNISGLWLSWWPETRIASGGGLILRTTYCVLLVNFLQDVLESLQRRAQHSHCFRESCGRTTRPTNRTWQSLLPVIPLLESYYVKHIQSSFNPQRNSGNMYSNFTLATIDSGFDIGERTQRHMGNAFQVGALRP